MPTEVNGAVLTVDNQVSSTNSVIEYTYVNETGFVIFGDCHVEKLEMKVFDEWQEIPTHDSTNELTFYVNPGDSYSKKFDAGFLLPGTYKLTVSYNVCNGFNTQTEGFASVEFTVTALN